MGNAISYVAPSYRKKVWPAWPDFSKTHLTTKTAVTYNKKSLWPKHKNCRNQLHAS